MEVTAGGTHNENRLRRNTHGPACAIPVVPDSFNLREKAGLN
jgi:hypothetical protein